MEGYWLSTASTIENYVAWTIFSVEGAALNPWNVKSGWYDKSSFGLRPVITLSK